MELSKEKLNASVGRLKEMGITGEDLREAGGWVLDKRVGCAQYDPEANVINLHVYNGNSVYEVDLDRCTTPAQLLDWIFQLTGKTWCKGSVLMDFIICLEGAIEERHGVDVYAYFKVHE